jgi:cytochrome c peroxidase
VSLVGCSESSSPSSVDKPPSVIDDDIADKTPSTIDDGITDKELVDVIDQEVLSKAVLKKGGVFTYQFKLGAQQQLRFIDEDHLGKVVFVDNKLHYTAGASLGTDIIRFELQSLGEAALNSQPKIIRWMFSITDDEPRFEILSHNTLDDAASVWSCVQDNDTNEGVTWLVANETNAANYAWGGWRAILPGFDAQCAATLGERENSECNTEHLISTLNNSNVCGKNDWRLPEAYEVNNIFDVNYLSVADNQPGVDPFYFPGIDFSMYWLSKDNAALGFDNQAYGMRFSRDYAIAKIVNKRLPQKVILVSGEVRDTSIPTEATEPLAEKDSFIRLHDNSHPLPRSQQQDDYAQTPWQCLEDLRPLVRDNIFLRDGKFASSYWFIEKDNTQQFLMSELAEIIKKTNQDGRCQRKDWRLPTQEELTWLLHKDIHGEYDTPYAVSLKHPAQGRYWVSNGDEHRLQSFPQTSDIAPTAIDENHAEITKGHIFLVALEHEYRPKEDARSVNNHQQPSANWLRASYEVRPELWPVPVIDDDVKDRYLELGPLPIADLFEGIPYNAAKISLGKKLFFDPMLSQNNDVSCASCHSAEKGWADGLETSIGHNQLRGKRNAPSIVNSAFLPTAFWDGRADTLEQQALMPIQDPVEMAQDLDALLVELNNTRSYREQFKQVFASSPIDRQQLSSALASFQRTIVSNENKLDKFILQVDKEGSSNALNDQELWGLDVFRRNGRCVNCHMGPEMTDHKFENVGLTYYKRFYQDLGRYNVTKNNADVGKFKTPGLRDVMNTGPWFHNGLVDTIEGLISMYSEGMATNDAFGWENYDETFPQLSPKIRPLNLSLKEGQALQAFLQAITAETRTEPATKKDLTGSH